MLNCILGKPDREDNEDHACHTEIAHVWLDCRLRMVMGGFCLMARMPSRFCKPTVSKNYPEEKLLLLVKPRKHTIVQCHTYDNDEF